MSGPELPVVPLEPGTLLIADLHLDVSPSADAGARAQREGFAAWLAQVDAPRLIVLGDLFDAWVGPAHARLEAAAELVGAFAALTARGVALDVVHGNRDFLLGAAFERATGGRVHPDGILAQLPGPQLGAARALLVHGDELCTLDHSYQRLKRVLRSAPLLWAAPRIPGPAALWVARRLRRASVRAVAHKPDRTKTQQEDAVLALAGRHGASTVVCGHAHRFRDGEVAGSSPDGSPVRWVVLDAFGGPRDAGRVAEGGELSFGASGVGP